MNGKSTTASSERQIADTRTKLHVLDGEIRGALEERGDRIAAEKGYKGISGMEAICRYLIDKHHWLPWDVARLSTDEIQMLLAGDTIGEAPAPSRRKG